MTNENAIRARNEYRDWLRKLLSGTPPPVLLERPYLYQPATQRQAWHEAVEFDEWLRLAGD